MTTGPHVEVYSRNRGRDIRVAGHDRDVVGACEMGTLFAHTLRRQAGRIGKLGVFHPQLSGPLVHHVDERLLRSAQMLGDRDGCIVRGADRNGIEQLAQGHLLPRFEPDLRPSHARCVITCDDEVVEGRGPSLIASNASNMVITLVTLAGGSASCSL